MASISALPRPLAWTREHGVRLRPVPEQAVCLAYRPQPPMLFGLNLTSWLLLTLTHWVIGLRVSGDDEREGLDIALHGEQVF